MNRKTSLLFYLGMLAIAVGVIIAIALQPGAIELQSDSTGGLLPMLRSNFETFIGFVRHHISSTFGLLLLQTIVILLFARIVALIFTRLGQPSVIGEILAGIILGPSVLGLIAPGLFGALFPESSLPSISLLSQFGLILFMFVIGMELDLSEIRRTFRQSLIISHTSIVAPFVLGAILALFLHDHYAGSSGDLLPFALFIGVSMSITAFPVLARIIQERGMMNSHIGLISMSSAANGDITAWCIVAVIMAIAQAGAPISALYTVLFAGVYMAVMFLIIKPLFKVIGKAYTNKEVTNIGLIALIFLTLLSSAYVTEILGLHALFGAFIAGVVMPEDVSFRRIMTEKVEDVSLSIFLPLFFVSSGLQTEIGLLNTPTHWWHTLIITLVAIAGKLLGTYMSCRVVGEPPRDSLYVGVLMNTRGLMELVVLSMGYGLGILSPEIYAMLVIMTLVTTFLTTPLLALVDRVWPASTAHRRRGVLNIVFSFGRTSTGVLILNILDTFFRRRTDEIEVTGLHMTVGTDVSPLQAEHFREESFAPIRALTAAQGHEVHERYEVTDSPMQTMVGVAHDAGAQLFLVGAGLDFSDLPADQALKQLHRKYQSRIGIPLATATAIFNVASLLTDRTEALIRQLQCAVGIVIDRHLSGPARHILVVEDPASAEHSDYLHLVQLLTHQLHSDGTVCTIDRLSLTASAAVALQQDDTASESYLSAELLRSHDLLVIPYSTWTDVIRKDPDTLSLIPTTMLLHVPKSSHIQDIQMSPRDSDGGTGA